VKFIKFLDIKTIGLFNFLFSSLFLFVIIYYEIIFYDISDLYNLSKDFQRLNRFPSISPLRISYLFFIPLFLINSKLLYEITRNNISKFQFFMYLFLTKIFVTTFMLYFLRIYSISRIKILAIFIIYPIVMYLLFQLLNFKKLFLLTYTVLIAFSSYLFADFDILYEYRFNKCINTFSTLNILNKYNNQTDTVFIIGHAYGSHSTQEKAMSNKVISMFENNNRTQDSYLVLTGDFVLKDDLTSLKLAKTQIEENFRDFMIAPGNHDFRDKNNYLNVFNKDLFFKEFNNFILISANYSNSNWDLTEHEKSKINKKINQVNSEVVFLFSHQLFWLDYIDYEIGPNGYNLLEESLKSDPLEWMDLKGKKLIVISGDYGGMGQDSYCSEEDGKLFIANGIGDLDTDTYIEIVYNDEGFGLRKRNLK
jgi:hypothetical protein